jgi:hypothetical protein
MVGQVVCELEGRAREQNDQQNQEDDDKGKENPPDGVVLHLLDAQLLST